MPYLEFKGRKFVENYHYTVPHHAFEFDPSLSILPSDELPSLDGNLLIEGDNLKALKSLLPTHARKIKCVYMDPPYNTGNEGWVYNDNLTQPQFKEWIGKTVGNEAEDGTRHDKWCCMMMPRLAVIKELLSEEGIVFVSIDDNEVHRLRLLMEDVFVEGGFVVSIIWKKRSTPPNDKVIGANHEYVLVFCKDAQKRELYLKERSYAQQERYSNPDNHPKGAWMAGDLQANVKGGRYVKSLYYGITNPETGQEHFPSEGGNWRFNKARMTELLKNNEIYFGENGQGRPKFKRFLRDVKSGVAWASIWDFVPLNAAGTAEVNSIFGKEVVFENPKPAGLIKELLKLGSDEGDIILDCTAGSGTTAHAVLQLNAEDGGNRHFILTQQKHDSKDDERKHINICQDITRERIKRVIEGTGTPALDGSFYARLSETPVLGAFRDLDPLPSYEELARTVFYTHTSRATDESQWNRESGFLGECNGEAIFLLYDSHADIELGLERAWLDAWGARNPCFDLVVYSEKFAMHRDDLREWCEKHGKTVKHLLVPYEIK